MSLNITTQTRDRSGTSKAPTLERIKSSPEEDTDNDQPVYTRATSSPSPESPESGDKKQKSKSKKPPPGSPFSIKAPPGQFVSRNRGTSLATTSPPIQSNTLQAKNDPKGIKSAPTSPQDNKEVTFLPKSTSGTSSPPASIDIFFDAFDDVQSTSTNRLTKSTSANTNRLEPPTTTTTQNRPRRGSIDHFTNLLNSRVSQDGNTGQGIPNVQAKQQPEVFSIF